MKIATVNHCAYGGSRITCLIPNIKRASLATRQTLTDVANFARELGFSIFKINFTDVFSIVRLFFGVLLKRFDLLIVIYPAIGNPIHNYHNYRSNWRDSLTAFKKNAVNLFLTFIEKVVPTILFIYDLPIEQNVSLGFSKRDTWEARRREYRLFQNAFCLLVFNRNMGEYIQKRYKIDRAKIVPFEILDYGSNVQTWLNLVKYNSENIKKFNIVYSSNFANKVQRDFILKLPESDNLNFIILGPNFDETILRLRKKLHVTYEGCLIAQDYISFLINKAHFGLVYKLSPYYEFGTTSKFSSYMVAGVPVLVPEDYYYLTKIVQKYNVGIVFKKLEDIPHILENLNTKDMRVLAVNAYTLGQKIKSGYFFKSAIKKFLILFSACSYFEPANFF